MAFATVGLFVILLFAVGLILVIDHVDSTIDSTFPDLD